MNISSEVFDEGLYQGNDGGLQDHTTTSGTINGQQLSNAVATRDALHNDSSEQTTSTLSSKSPQSSAPTSVLPRAEEIDRTLHHLGLENFATALEKAAAAVFPNDKKSRYSQVYVLLISWQTQDSNLPVEQEISALRKVLESYYHYDIEEFQIPDIDSHAEVSEKVNSFVKVGNNSSSDLKIVYYAGHSRLSRSKELLWSALPTRKDLKCPTVMWSGIQRSLEMANSDVLILLDSCSSGVANASEGNGVTELICACPFDSEANGVGHYSFTRSLTIELQLLRTKPCFSVAELYTSIYTRMQSFLPQGIENERYPAPVYFVLTNDEPFIRGIKLSVQDLRAPENEGMEKEFPKRIGFQGQSDGKRPRERESFDPPNKRSRLNDTQECAQEGNIYQTFEGNHAAESADHDHGHLVPKDSMYPLEAPRALFAIRFREDIKGEDLSVKLFTEWLRSIPAAVEEVCVEAGFKCFYTSWLQVFLNIIARHRAAFSNLCKVARHHLSISIYNTQPEESPGH
ncbi:hypothetical protein BKA64DRAFT_338838 [Cadophora sp. MPI-SDFR-AT-0126]|nr:hypothetical protein BKA64DRAFT_338838 [Leotiomycetes sp. MPI-SDFR-AT-0126]